MLEIVGDGFDADACRQLAAQLELGDRVRFLGQQPRAEVQAAYQRADLFVFPSYREPGGNVQFEAMAQGLPLVVSDRGGPASVVEPDRGVVVTPRDPEQYARDLAAAIRPLVNNPDRRLAMGAAARAYVVREGTWERRVEQLESIFDELHTAR